MIVYDSKEKEQTKSVINYHKVLYLLEHAMRRNISGGEKERCSGSFHLAVGFLVIKDDSISERPG